jgi:DNA repair protein RadC
MSNTTNRPTTLNRTFTINDLPDSEKPRERLQEHGAGALSVQELIAVILGRGIAGESVTVTAQRLFDQFGTLRGIAGATVEELMHVKGIGLAKASQIKAVFELAGRLESNPDGDKRTVKAPEDVRDVVREHLRGVKKECFLALLLTTRGKLIKVSEVSVGSLDSSLVHPREVFREAMSAAAASVVFVHNHPSGDPSPSAEDVKMTERLVQVGQLVGIDVLDHIIVSDSDFTSMKRKGML